MKEEGFKQYSTSGNTLHWGKDAPNRGWDAASDYGFFNEIEK